MTIVGSGGNTGISLTKGSNASISLAKHAEVRATLEWDGGSAFRRAKGADLELYALYVTKEQASKLSKGKGGAIYWNNLQQPGIRHHGDSLEPGVETVTITDPSKFDYVLIVAYSAISNGAGSFKSYGAKAVVTDNMSQTVTVPLFDNTESYWVAIALIDLKTDGKINIKHVETYSAGGEARPVLYTDGTFKMDVGPVEFKR
jgi:uncharacterized protein involved in tellurium resistance